MEDILKFLLEFKDVILAIIYHLTVPTTIFLISLAFIYVIGRMLNLVKEEHYVIKNFIAFVMICGLSYFYDLTFLEHNNILEQIWSMLIPIAESIVLYVWIGFKAYERLDNLQDKKIAPDNEDLPKRRRTKKSK